MMRTRIRSSLAFPVFLASLALFTGGCSTDTTLQVPEADNALLDAMAHVREGEARYALLTSRDGLVACLPVEDGGVEPPPVPVRGLFWQGARLMDGWSWRAELPGKTNPALRPLERPDHVDRPIPGIGLERVVLDPDASAGIILLTEGPGQDVHWTPRLDLRPIDVPDGYATIAWDEDREVLLAELPESGLTLALVSNGTWAKGEREERIDYARGWAPLDGVASVREPGEFTFPKAKGAMIAFGVSLEQADAIRLARAAFEEHESVVRGARDRALEALNRHPLASMDTDLAAVAAWDRWWVEEGLWVNVEGQRLPLARAPLPYAGDPVSDLALLPVQRVLQPGNMELARRIASDLTPELAEHDLEGYTIALSTLLKDASPGLLTDSLLLEQAGILMNHCGALLENINVLDTLSLTTRWGLDLQDAGLHLPPQGTRPSLKTLFLRTARSLMTTLNRIGVDSNPLEAVLLRDGRFPRYQVFLPDPIVFHPPVTWGEEEAETYREGIEDPRLNLAWFERSVLEPALDDPGELAHLALRLWGGVDGLTFHASEAYSEVTFTSPRWLAWQLTSGGHTPLADVVLEAWRHPDYRAWVRSAADGSPDLPGGGIVDLETAARRTAFFYQFLPGVQWTLPRARAGKPGATPSPAPSRLALAPAAPLEFWEGRAVTFGVGDEPHRVTIEMDPWNGIYRVAMQKGGARIYLDLIDVPVDGEQLVASVELVPGRTVELRRVARGSGRNTLTMDGVELRNVVHQEIR